MATEMVQNVKYKSYGKYSVSSDIFIDLIFNETCNCNCKFCIAKTPTFAKENFERWKETLQKTFETFDEIQNVIILGGEATVDPLFFEKLEVLQKVIKGKHIDNVILTTNAIRLRNPHFLEKLLNSCVTTVNVSCMHYDKIKNDEVMRGRTLTREELREIYQALKNSGRTMRLNCNVFAGNMDSMEELEKYILNFTGICDVIKFSPLMITDMFHTTKDITDYTHKVCLSEEKIKEIYDKLAEKYTILTENNDVFGLIPYKEIYVGEQKVILKYKQVEDTYDLDTVIPTLKLYSNGNLSNEWDYQKDILEDFIREKTLAQKKIS